MLIVIFCIIYIRLKFFYFLNTNITIILQTTNYANKSSKHTIMHVYKVNLFGNIYIYIELDVGVVSQSSNYNLIILPLS